MKILCVLWYAGLKDIFRTMTIQHREQVGYNVIHSFHFPFLVFHSLCMAILIVYILYIVHYGCTWLEDFSCKFIMLFSNKAFKKVSTKFAKYGMSLGYFSVNNRLAMVPTFWMTMNDTILVLKKLLIRSFLRWCHIGTLFGVFVAITSQWLWDQFGQRITRDQFSAYYKETLLL